MRILVIEDEHKIAQAIKKGLEQETYATDVAYTGSEGYDLAAGEDYDLIILDILLPEMDGIDVCRRLREQNIKTPILMLTAKGQVEDKVLGLNAGSDDYLTKPFAFEELFARVRALARRPSIMTGAELIYQDLSLNVNTFEVCRQNRQIKLSKKEYALLEYLLRHPEQILTKEQIINHVWNYEAEVLPNTVEVFVGNLRKKIDQPFPQQPALIHTVRGFGYKLGLKK